MNIALQGFFNIEKRNANNEIIESYAFKNLILDSGMDMIGWHGVDTTQYCYLGTGNSQPINTQTTLDNYLNDFGVYGGYEYKYDLTGEQKKLNIVRSYRFAQGIATGNISEIGLSYHAEHNSGVNPLFCRALIKDGSGMPTVITKLADEILDIYYTLQIIIPTQDVTGQIMVKGEMYNTIARPAYLGHSNEYFGVLYGGGLGDVTGTPDNELKGWLSQQQTYMGVGVHKVKIAMFVPDTQGNYPDGIRSVHILCPFNIKYQIQYSRVSDNSPIIKNDTESLTFNFEFGWERA